MQEHNSKMREIEAPPAGWLDRLREAIDRDGRSLRVISLTAGLSHAYLHSLLNGTRAPSIDNLAAIAAAMNASLGYIILGIEIDAIAERLLKAWAAYPEAKREALLELLSADSRPSDNC
jgi:transcriptional regulator with XRE-family HTH domain